MALPIADRPLSSDSAILATEAVERSYEGSPDAMLWERAQWAFEHVAAWSSGCIARRWDRLPGLDRAIWHDVIVTLAELEIIEPIHGVDAR